MKENHPEQLSSCRDNGFCFLSYTDTGAVVKITIYLHSNIIIYNICLKLISVNNWYLFYLVRLSLKCQFILFIVMCICFCQVKVDVSVLIHLFTFLDWEKEWK